MSTPASARFDERGCFLGHLDTVHDSYGGRARCFDCTEWCSANVPCTCCELEIIKNTAGRFSGLPDYLAGRLLAHLRSIEMYDPAVTLMPMTARERSLWDAAFTDDPTTGRVS